MKIPRDVSGLELAQLLKKHGYRTTRQTGSHIRLTTRIKGIDHHITIPNHKPIKVGTLSDVLSDIAQYLKIDKDELLEGIFGKK